MATKREVVAKLSHDELKLLAESAEEGAKTFPPREQKRIKRAVKLLKTVKAAH
jgi:F0F1-type ATP synthase epsilon subunit